MSSEKVKNNWCICISCLQRIKTKQAKLIVTVAHSFAVSRELFIHTECFDDFIRVDTAKSPKPDFSSSSNPSYNSTLFKIQHSKDINHPVLFQLITSTDEPEL